MESIRGATKSFNQDGHCDCIIYDFDSNYDYSRYSARVKSDFNIVPPNIKVGDSKYSKLHYIEARENPDDMGFAYVHSWNGVQAITLSSSIEVQLQSLVGTVVLPSDEGKTIAVQMRILFFDVGNGRAESKSKCNLRMTLYEMDDNGNYYFLNTLDSIVISG